MITKRLVPVLLLCALVPALAGEAPKDPLAEKLKGKATVTGTAAYPKGTKLPATAKLEVTLEELAEGSGPGNVLGGVRVEPGGTSPIQFAISYEPRRVKEDRGYVVRARIVDGERVLFTSGAGAPVLTKGKSNSASLRLTKAPK